MRFNVNDPNFVSAVLHGRSRPGLGLGYMGDSSLSTIAEVDPEPISHAALSILGLFNIGAGRKEADIITPVQNRVVSDVIAPVSAMLNSPNADSFSSQQWQQALTAVENTERSWLNYLHNTQWPDGRAAKGAEATLAPYFEGAIQQLQARIASAPTSFTQAITGAPGVVGVTDPGIPGQPLPPVSQSTGVLSMGYSTLLPVAVAGIALWYFMGRRRG